MLTVAQGHCLLVGRLDPDFRSLFNENALDQESLPRIGRSDADFLEREHQHMANVAGFKQDVRERLTRLPLFLTSMEEKKGYIIEMVRHMAPTCLRNYQNAVRPTS
jgi:hypothetical protein